MITTVSRLQFLVLVVLLLLCNHLDCKETLELQKSEDSKISQEQDSTTYYNGRELDYDMAQSLLSNGDIRLSVSKEADSRRISMSSGRLEVYVIALLNNDPAHTSWDYTPGVWGTVCGSTFSIKEAHVACRQLGYQQALKWELSSESEFGKGNQSRPIFLNGIGCPNSETSHIMRCRPAEEPSDSCSHDNDVALYCGKGFSMDESESQYSGQVRLVSEMENSSMSVSSGRVEVYRNGVWGTVCSNNFSQAAADTVCRQLGYTNALEIYSALPGEGQVQVDNIVCSSSSACFKSCYNSHHLPYQCNHTNDVAIQCTYDISLAVDNTSGDENQCRVQPHPLIFILSITILSLASVLVAGMIVSVILCVVCYSCRKRKQAIKLYEPL